MAIRTEFECDRCGHKQPTHDQMWDVGFGYCYHGQSLFRPGEYQSPRATIVQLWCRKCLEHFNFLPCDKPKTPPPAPPTLEDMFREMMREEIEAARGEQ